MSAHKTACAAAVAKYQAAGWIVIVLPGKTINDLICARGAVASAGTVAPASKLHFVQIVPDITAGKFTGLQRNTFIQNAFSNGAVPVYAIADGAGVKLVDINEDRGIILRAVMPAGANTHANTKPAQRTKDKK